MLNSTLLSSIESFAASKLQNLLAMVDSKLRVKSSSENVDSPSPRFRISHNPTSISSPLIRHLSPQNSQMLNKRPIRPIKGDLRILMRSLNKKSSENQLACVSVSDKKRVDRLDFISYMVTHKNVPRGAKRARSTQALKISKFSTQPIERII